MNLPNPPITKETANFLKLGYAVLVWRQNNYWLEHSNAYFKRYLNLSLTPGQTISVKEFPALFGNEVPFRWMQFFHRCRNSGEQLSSTLYTRDSAQGLNVSLFPYDKQFVLIVSAAIESQTETNEPQETATPNKQLLQKVRRLEKQYRQLAEQSAFPIIIHSQNKIEYLNDKAIQFLGGQSASEFIRASVWDIIDKTYYENNPPQASEREVQLIKKQGGTAYAMLSGYPMYYQGKSAIKLILRDITQQKEAEKNRRELQTRFEAFMQYLPASVFIKDSHSRLLYVNPYYNELFHSEQWINQTPEEIMPPEQARQVRHNDQITLKQGKQEVVEELVTLAGATHYFRTIKFVIEQESSGPLIAGISWDITSEHKARKALKKSEAQYKQVTSSITDIIYTADSQRIFTFISGNTALFGSLNPFDYLGRSMLDLIHILKIPEQVKEQLINQAREAISTKQQSITYLVPITSKGQQRYFEVKESLEYGQQGKLKRVSGLARNVTQRVKAEQQIVEKQHALIESQKKYKQLLDAMHDAVILLDENARVVFANPYTQNLLGTQHPQLIQKTIYTFLNDSSKKIIRLYFNQPVHNRSKKELIIIQPSGKTRYTLASIGPLGSQGSDYKQHILILKDITYRKYAEDQLREAKDQLEASNNLKTLFLRNISHEIRTPMNAILGFSQLLKADSKPDKRNEYLAIITKSTKRLLELFTNFIDSSQLQANQLKLMPEPTNLHDLLADLRNELYQKYMGATNKNIHFSFQIPDKNVPLYSLDGMKLCRIITILVDNAFKFTKKGFIRVKSDIRQQPTGTELVCSISDSGIGISADDQQQLFTPFYKGSTEAKDTLYEGTGLGLSLAKGFIELMNGTVELQSAIGKGTQITFTLPIKAIT